MCFPIALLSALYLDTRLNCNLPPILALNHCEINAATDFCKGSGARFLAWDAANRKSWHAGEKQTELTMDGQHYYQKTFKYSAHTFELLKTKFAQHKDSRALQEFLHATDRWEHLQ